MYPWKKAAIVLCAMAVLIRAADPSLLSLAMPDARMVSGINIERSLASPIGQFFMSEIQSTDPGFQKFIAETGFDPRYDLKEILIASPATAKSSPFLILARGRFDPVKILAIAKKQKAAVRDYKGVPFLSSDFKNSHLLPQTIGQAGPLWFAFLDPSIAALGDAASVRGAIDRRGMPSRLNLRIASRVQELSSQYDWWGVSVVPPSEFSGQLPDQRLAGALKGDVLRSIAESSGGVRLGADIDVFGEAVTRSEKDAQALVDVLRFFSGLLQLNQPNAKITGPAKLLQSLNLTTQGNLMRLSMKIPSADVEKFIREAKAGTQQAGVRARPSQPTPAGAPQAPPVAPAPPERSGGIIIHSAEGRYEIKPQK